MRGIFWTAAVIAAVTYGASAHAKCWSMNELPPTYCMRILVKSVEKGTFGRCTISASVEEFHVPHAESQHLDRASKIQPGAVFKFVSAGAFCVKAKPLESLYGLAEASCNDKRIAGDRDSDYPDYRFSAELKKKVEFRQGTVSKEINCTELDHS